MVEKRLMLAEGRSVPMEDGSAWPAEGAPVEVTLYIRRRIRDGDLVDAPESIAADAPAIASDEPEILDPPRQPPEGPAAEPPHAPENAPGRKGRKGDR